MDRNMVFGILLVVLIVVSAVQAVQIASLSSGLETGSVSLTGAPTGDNPNQGGQVSLPQSLKNLPGMVGGC